MLTVCIWKAPSQEASRLDRELFLCLFMKGHVSLYSNKLIAYTMFKFELSLDKVLSAK